jgi:hypothetical protein
VSVTRILICAPAPRQIRVRRCRQDLHPDQGAGFKGLFDEWLARIVCFAFSISPQALTQQMNRATAETQKEIAEEEGLAPVRLGEGSDRPGDRPGIRRARSRIYLESRSLDRSADAGSDPLELHVEGIPTINEARATLGRDPLADPAADKPMALTGAGYAPLGNTAGRVS